MNGSALLQIRTNEVPLSPVEPKLWEMREFVLGPSGAAAARHGEAGGGRLAQRHRQRWATWVGANAAAILAGQHVVPRTLAGPALPGRRRARALQTWPGQVPGVTEEVRHAFAQATCSGCHKSETGTNFLHVRTREVGSPSLLSAFLTQELSPAGPRVTDFHELLNTRDPDRA